MKTVQKFRWIIERLPGRGCFGPSCVDKVDQEGGEGLLALVCQVIINIQIKKDALKAVYQPGDIPVVVA